MKREVVTSELWLRAFLHPRARISVSVIFKWTIDASGREVVSTNPYLRVLGSQGQCSFLEEGCSCCSFKCGKDRDAKERMNEKGTAIDPGWKRHKVRVGKWEKPV